DLRPSEALRFTRLRERRPPFEQGRDFLEGLVLLPEVEEVRRRDPSTLQPARTNTTPHHDEPVWFLVWQRAQEYTVDDAEDRRGRADAQRQCDDGYQGEAGLLQ